MVPVDLQEVLKKTPSPLATGMPVDQWPQRAPMPNPWCWLAFRCPAQRNSCRFPPYRRKILNALVLISQALAEAFPCGKHKSPD